MINPVIFVKDNNEFACPFCGKQIIKVQNETLAIMIDKEGHPINNKSVIKEKFICCGCKRDFSGIVEQNGIDFKFIDKNKSFNIKVVNPFTGEGCYDE